VSRARGPRLGVDLAEVGRVAELAERFDDRELGLLFSSGERDAARRARDRHRYLAVCVAAKEAVGKALGVGLAGIDWPDVEAVIEGPALRVRLSGRAALLAGRTIWTASFACWDGLVLVQVAGWPCAGS
jgi:holo-[acyl-carrier protein] synthase